MKLLIKTVLVYYATIIYVRPNECLIKNVLGVLTEIYAKDQSSS